MHNKTDLYSLLRYNNYSELDGGLIFNSRVIAHPDV